MTTDDTTPNQERCDRWNPPDDLPDVHPDTEDLVDVLSRGGPPPPGDELAALLARWRDDVATGLDTPTDATTTPPPPSRGARILAFARRTRTATRPQTRPGDHRPPRRPSRVFRTVTAAATGLTILVAGIAVGSWNTNPDGKLWPVTRVLYPDHAEAVAIQTTIDQARQAITADDFPRAAQLINKARHQLAYSNLDEPTAEALRTQIDELIVDLAQIDPDQPPGHETTPDTTDRATTHPERHRPTPTPTRSPAPTPAPATAPAPAPPGNEDGALLPPPASPTPSESPTRWPGLLPDLPLLPSLPIIGG
ncbi:hypothetical protein AB0F93_03480 [Micromonospora tulbaghiae]|uniref:hypothetical protein n=1 Tax=Micromonospora tulbaghiae TaxID=479978 RepID=UPI003331E1A8